jgi:hypothetical protein
MAVAKTASCALALILMVGCGTPKTATLFQEDKAQIKVTIAAKTGDSLDARFVQSVPSGTRVTILDDSSSETTIRVRIEQGEFKGQEATVARNALRLTE